MEEGGRGGGHGGSAMPPALVSDPTAKRKVRAKIYGLRTFLDPGCPTDFYGAFRDNVRRFLHECGDVEKRDTAGMPTWCTLLVDERSGAVAPLYTVEESVRHCRSPFCDHCRCTGEFPELSWIGWGWDGGGKEAGEDFRRFHRPIWGNFHRRICGNWGFVFQR